MDWPISFLVAFNGQFATLITPPSQGGVTPIQHVSPLSEVHEFKEILDGVEHNEPHRPAASKLDLYKQSSKTYEDHRKRFYARDIMSHPAKVIFNSLPAVEAKELMTKFGFRHLPVVNEANVILGMISDREISGSLEKKTCAEIMVNKLIVCEENASVNEIAIIFLKEKINALPIMNHNREVSGIITMSDILKYVVGETKFLGRG